MKDVKLVDLFALWASGGREQVVDALEREGAAITALFIIEGVKHDDDAVRLSRADCDTITNMLVDRRVALFQKPRENAGRFFATTSDNVRDVADMVEQDGGIELAIDYRRVASALRSLDE